MRGVTQRIDNQMLGLLTDLMVTKGLDIDLANVANLTRGLGVYVDSRQRFLQVVSNAFAAFSCAPMPSWSVYLVRVSRMRLLGVPSQSV